MPADRELKPDQRMKTKVRPTPTHQLAMSRGHSVHSWFTHQTLATVRFHCWVRWSRVQVRVNRHLGDSLPSHHSDSAGNSVLALSVQCWRSCLPSAAERSCNDSFNDCVVDDCDDYQKIAGEDDDDHEDNTDEKNTFFRNGSKSRLEMKRRSLRTMMVFGVDRRRMRL